MKTVVGVRFKRVGKIYYFDPGNIALNAGDGVIVETARGVEYGDVIVAPREVAEKEIVSPLKKVLRKATEKDLKVLENNLNKEYEAFQIALKKIDKHEMDMKLVDVEYTFDGSKVIFYFTADGRVDFRELVKDLAHHFKTRIELRQIGVRDEAKMLGGLGKCGRPICCGSFLGEFQPVSIKMAKEQSISLNPTKISGLCGRLMCCLNYEQKYYEQMRKRMPKINREVVTPDGPATVLENNAITEKVKVRITLPDETVEVREYPLDEITIPRAPRPTLEKSAKDRPQNPPKKA